MDKLFVTLYLFGLELLFIQDETVFLSSSSFDGNDIEAKANEIFDNGDFFEIGAKGAWSYLKKYLSKSEKKDFKYLSKAT